MGQETNFYDVGFSSVDGIKKVDIDDRYFVINVTFGDGNTGELLYPYRVNSTGETVVIDSGPQGAFIRIPVSVDDKDGYRKKSIGLTSDVPSWVRKEIKELIYNNNQITNKIRQNHNILELDLEL